MNNQKMVASLLQECKQVLDHLPAVEEDPSVADKSEHHRGEAPVADTGCNTVDEASTFPSLPYFSSASRQVSEDYWISRT